MKPGFTARGAIAVASLLALTLAGCQSTKTTQVEPRDSGTTGSEFREDPMRSDKGTASASSMLQPIYFDFDRFEIRSDARPLLRANADAIKGNGHWGAVTIEGHCDERGSEEYNLALGERRARAVRRYLMDLGVPASRLDVVSFGEAKPAVMGHDESAWRYNRRSEFSSGG